MKNKIKSIIKIICPIFIVSSIFFGFLTSSISKKQSDRSLNFNLSSNEINNNLLKPVKLNGLIMQTSISDETSSALLLDNNLKTNLYMWGKNDKFQQGNEDKDKKPILTPTKVNFKNLPKGSKIAQISMSNDTSSALIIDNNKNTSIYMWGDNKQGQQGNGKGDGKTDNFVKTPQKVNFKNLPKGSKITQMSMSNDTSSALVEYSDNSTHLYMWGNNKYGQQGNGKGDGKADNIIKTPTEVTKLNNFVKSGDKITQISMSNETSSALVEYQDGHDSLYMWGNNDLSQQESDKKDKFKVKNITEPKKVSGLDDILKNGSVIAQISMSDLTSSALVEDPSSGKTHLYMWGSNHFGQQGDDNYNEVSSIKEDKDVKIDTNKKEFKIIRISMSDHVSSAEIMLKDSKETKMYMWGRNDKGQQGDGGSSHQHDIKKPTEVKSLEDAFSSNISVTQVAISNFTSSLTILDEEKLCMYIYMWGSNSSGQQGDGTKGNISYPKKVLITKSNNSPKEKNNTNYVLIILPALFALIIILFIFLWFIKNKSINKQKLSENN